MRTFKSQHIARVLDHRALHAKADAEEGDAMFARVANRGDLAFDAALTKAARHQDSIHTFEQLQTCAGDILCTDLAQHDLALVRDAGVRQRLVDRLVGIV